MKTTHIKWEPMWEKYFSNYPGFEPVIECSKIRCEEQESAQPQIDAAQKADTPGTRDLYGLHDISIDGERYSINGFLSEPKSGADRFYPVEKDADIGYMINEAEQILVIDPTPDSGPAPVIDSHPIETEQHCPLNPTASLPETEKQQVEKSAPAHDIYTVKSKAVGKLPADIIFECGTGQGFAFVTRDGEALTHTPYNKSIAKTLGIAAIDTTSLKYPKTKVLFSCIIDFRSRGPESTAQLEFVLSRSCNNGPESPIGNWVYEIEGLDACTQTFRFNFCSCKSFPGCYYYYVRVLPAYIKNCSVCITNCHIDAFAQSIL